MSSPQYVQNLMVCTLKRHAVLGDDIAKCLKLALDSPGDAQENPESYVFFIAHMYHLFGNPGGGNPWSIDRPWNFKLTRSNGEAVFGAAEHTGLAEAGAAEEHMPQPIENWCGFCTFFVLLASVHDK